MAEIVKTISNDIAYDKSFELTEKIYSSFDWQRSIEINRYCNFIFIASDKMAVRKSQKLMLSSFERKKLKECIQAIHGKKIRIIALPVPTEDNSRTKKACIWEKIKQDIKSSLLQGNCNKKVDGIMHAWFGRLSLVEDLGDGKYYNDADSEQERLILKCNSCVGDYIKSSYRKDIEYVLKTNNLIIELQCRDNYGTTSKILFGVPAKIFTPEELKANQKRIKNICNNVFKKM